MKIYKYEYKEQNLITLINEEKIYSENPMYAIGDFDYHVPCLLDETDELIYEYEQGLKYYNKNIITYEIKEKNEKLDNLIDSIDVFIEKKKIRDELIKKQENNENNSSELP